MESANLHPHDRKVQEQYVKYSSLVTPASHQVSTIDEWNSNLFPSRDLNETLTKSRDPWPASPPLMRTSMSQDSFNQQSTSEFALSNIKDEMSDSFPKLGDLMYSHSIDKHHYYPQYSSGHHDVGGNLWHTNFPIANNMTELQLSSGELYGNPHQNHPPCSGTAPATSTRYEFNHIFPSTNVSPLDLCSTLFPSSLDLNLKSLDLLTSTYDGGTSTYNQSLIDIPGKLSTSMLMGHESHDHRREVSDSTSTSSKVSAFVSGSNTSTKRPGSSFSDTKESTDSDSKKHKSSMSRPTLKLQVRKEKLGDRVAALQKLVAPFGKTDTATVLTEAIGYIQFLQDQIQTLSVPFMKSSSQSKFYRTMQGSREGGGEQKRDLRSRGLCLVPQSTASYFISSCTSGI